MDNTQLDKLIASYSDELLKQNTLWQSKGLTPLYEEKTQDDINEEISNQEQSEDYIKDEEQDSEVEEKTDADDNTEQENVSSESSVMPDSTANFFARVLSANGAYPVFEARVLLYKDGELFKVLTTSISGETPKVKIPAYSKENSLNPQGENQRFEYSADIYADGFVTQKGLVVSAVGDSEIILAVQLTPVEERIE